MEPLVVEGSEYSSRVLRELEVYCAPDDCWYEAKVLSTEQNCVHVCRKSWPRSFAEWIPRASERLAPAATHLGQWRDFKINQAVQIGCRQHPNDSVASHWLPGTIHALSRDECGVSRVEVQWDGVGLVVREWRDADDDLLAPPGLPMYSTNAAGVSAVPSAHDCHGKKEPTPGQVLGIKNF